MRTSKLVSILLILTVVLSTFSPVSSQIVHPPQGSLQAALLPWTIETFYSYSNSPFVSAGFAGANQIPVFTYSLGQTYNMAYKIDGTTNECGPGKTWTCQGVGFLYFYNNKLVGPVTVFNGIGYFKLGWVWVSGGHEINIQIDTYDNDFTRIDTTQTINLMNLNLSPWTGYSSDTAPALAFDSLAQAHVAVVIKQPESTVEEIIYIHPSEAVNPSCKGAAGSNSTWVCDSIRNGFYGEKIQLDLTSSDSPRISFYNESADSLMYAYRVPSLLIYDPNCEPDNTTWRCIAIDQGPGADKIDSNISMDMGPNNSAQIAYQYDHTGERYLKLAKYVSTGGDCGLDLRVIDISPPQTEEIYRWKCTTVTIVDYSSPYIDSLPSLKVDPNNYAVIAYAQDHNGPSSSLNLVFPAERVGGSPNSYVFNEIDLPVEQSLGLAINHTGLGLIAYKGEGMEVNLKIAYQQYSLNLPIIRR